MENPRSQNLLFLVMADISAIGPQRVNGVVSKSMVLTLSGFP